MTDERAVLKLLNDSPTPETTPWIFGEPAMQDLLADPLIHAVLRRDGLSLQDLRRAIALGRGRLAAPPAATQGPVIDAA